MTPNQRFVTQVFADLLRRSVGPTCLAFFTRLLEVGGTAAQMVQGSREPGIPDARGPGPYGGFLGRDADAGGLTTFVALGWR